MGWHTAVPAARLCGALVRRHPARRWRSDRRRVARRGRGPLQHRRYLLRHSLAEPVAAHLRLSRVFPRLHRSGGGEPLRRRVVHHLVIFVAIGQSQNRRTASYCKRKHPVLTSAWSVESLSTTTAL